MNFAKDTDPHKPVIVLFRHDLRVMDNAALHAAAESSKPVVPVFVFDDESEGIRPIGGARRWWLHHSLESLAKALKERGIDLILRKGKLARIADELVAETGADAMVWNRFYGPAQAKIDAGIKTSLREKGILADSFDGQLLHEPTLLKTKSGGFYKVFSPFWRALESEPEPREPIQVPAKLLRFAHKIKTDALNDWGLLPKNPDWAGGLKERWQPGEDGAHARLDEFIQGGLNGYQVARDFPARDDTSHLSPHLAHGEITPFQIFAALRHKSVDAPRKDIDTFRKELGWREFCYHLLFHNPNLATVNFNPSFEDFPWKKSAKLQKAWQRGQTGYPIVDAGMNELWKTGWMHNRVRMIVASFLIKDLLQDWRDGEAWFWDTLVDADPASNAANWQWVAGSGADAAPYFRIFNPTLQGQKFDPDGDYVRRYVPTLASLTDKYIHEPAKASKEALSRAKLKLGDGYPVPVVDHNDARDRAMAAYRKTRDDA